MTGASGGAGAGEGRGGLRRVARHARTGALLAVGLALLVWVALPGGFFDTSRNWLFDLYQRAWPAHRGAAQITIIDIDSVSLGRIGQWPWTRDQLAKLVDAARGARVVGIDILLAEPDRLSPPFWARGRAELAPAIREALQALPSSDAALAASLSRVPTVLAAATTAQPDEEATSTVPVMPIVEAGQDPRPTLPRFNGLIRPLPMLAAAARGTGIISIPLESDGVLRRSSAIVNVGSTLVPDFALAVAALAEGAAHITVHSGFAGLDRIEIGDRSVYGDWRGRVRVRYADTTPAIFVPAWRVLDGEADPGLFRGRIVLIGASAPGLASIAATPLRRPEPGVGVEAHMVATLLAGDALWRPPAMTGIEFVVAMALGISGFLLFGRVRDHVYATLLAGLGALTIAGSLTAFHLAGLLVDWTFPLTALAAAAVYALAARARRDARERRFREAKLAVALRQVELARQLEDQAHQLADTNDRLQKEIAQRHQVEEQLIRAQRMEAIGQLTGGIAHDFNNLLTAVLGNLDLASRRQMADDARHLVAQAGKAAERSARLTTHLLAFSRKQMLSVEAIDLNQLVLRLDEMLSRTLTPAIEIEKDLAPGLWLAEADDAKLELALVNLMINARDAMPRGGTLTIRTRNLGPDDTGRPEDLPEGGDFVVLTVADTGTGMTEEVRRRAFEPFFTTKEIGQGSGLGLSMVYGLAKQLGGTVRLESRVGYGTDVSIFLPRAASAVAAEAAVGSSHAEPGGKPGVVLLVDDNGAVREIVGAMLEELHHEVIAAEDGDAALAILDSGQPVDIMITDIVMPGGDGIALAIEARRRRPGLPILLMTGFPGDVPGAAAQQNWVVLRKPFRPDELDAMIRACRARAPAETLVDQSL